MGAVGGDDLDVVVGPAGKDAVDRAVAGPGAPGPPQDVGCAELDPYPGQSGDPRVVADAVSDGGNHRTVLGGVGDRLIDQALGEDHYAAPAQGAVGHRSAGQIADQGYRRRCAFPVFPALPVVEIDEVVGDVVLPHEGGQFLGRAGHSDEEGGAGLEEDHRALRHPGKRCVVEHDGAQ